MPSLLPEELVRYARQIGPGVLTVEGQEKLKNSAALISRAGGMGGPAALALVMAGVGKVIIAHGGRLVSPDLNRQVLGSERVLGEPRACHFAEYLRSMNRFVTVEAVDHEPDDAEAIALARRVNIVLSLRADLWGTAATERRGSEGRRATDRCGSMGNDGNAACR